VLLDVALEAVLVEGGGDGDAIGAASRLGVEVPSSGWVTTSAGGDVARVVGAGQDGTEILARTESVENTHAVHLTHDQLRDQVPCETGESKVEDKIDDGDASSKRTGFQSQSDELGNDSLGFMEGRLDAEQGPNQDHGDTEIDDSGHDEPSGNENGNVWHETEELDLGELDCRSDTTCQRQRNSSTTDTQENLALRCPVATLKEERLSDRSNASRHDDLAPQTPILMIEVAEITEVLHECSVRVFVVHSRL